MTGGYPEHIVRQVDAARMAQAGHIDLPALIEKYRNSSSAHVRQLARGTEALMHAAQDWHWMARRYADGRQSYAVGMHNGHTRTLIGLNITLNATGDGTLWAKDGNPGMPGPTPADMGPEWSLYQERLQQFIEISERLRQRAERAEAALKAAGLPIPEVP